MTLCLFKLALPTLFVTLCPLLNTLLHVSSPLPLPLLPIIFYLLYAETHKNY